jgi:hypothetical protein
MALSINSENPIRSSEANNKSDKHTSKTPKQPDYLEGLIACSIIAKLQTKSGDNFQRIRERDVLDVIQALRSNQIRVISSGAFEIVKLNIADGQRITLRLIRGSVKAVIDMKLDLADEQLKVACAHPNSENVEKQLSLQAHNIQEHSHRSSPRNTAQLVAQTKSILFA